MPWAKVTSASLWFAVALAGYRGALVVAEDAAELDDDVTAVSEPVFEQALITKVDTANAAIPNPIRLCCIAHPFHTSVVTLHCGRAVSPRLSPRLGMVSMGQLVFR